MTAPGGELSEVRILIVDDDEGSQDMPCNKCSDSEGWRVRVVPFASEAMRELARRPLDAA